LFWGFHLLSLKQIVLIGKGGRVPVLKYYQQPEAAAKYPFAIHFLCFGIKIRKHIVIGTSQDTIIGHICVEI